MTSDAS